MAEMIGKIIAIFLWIILCQTGCFAKNRKKPQETHLTPELCRQIIETANKYQLPPLLVLELIRAESSFQTGVRSNKNARGLMQLIPATAERFGVTDPYDPKQAIEGGCRYLVFLAKLFKGNLPLILAGYNAGENRVIACNMRVPNIPETKNYVRTIIAGYKRACELEAELTGNYVAKTAVSKAEIKKRLDALDQWLLLNAQ